MTIGIENTQPLCEVLKLSGISERYLRSEGYIIEDVLHGDLMTMKGIQLLNNFKSLLKTVDIPVNVRITEKFKELATIIRRMGKNKIHNIGSGSYFTCTRSNAAINELNVIVLNDRFIELEAAVRNYYSAQEFPMKLSSFITEGVWEDFIQASDTEENTTNFGISI